MIATTQQPKTPGTYWFRATPESDWKTIKLEDQHGILVAFPHGYCRGVHDIIRDHPCCEWGDRAVPEPEN